MQRSKVKDSALQPDRDRSVVRQPLRYLLIAAFSALLLNIVLISVHALGAHYLAALIAANIVVIVFAYTAHANFTFEVEYSAKGFWRFVGTQAIGFPLSVIVLIALVDGLGLAVWIATPIATLILFAYNFLSARWAILLSASPKS